MRVLTSFSRRRPNPRHERVPVREQFVLHAQGIHAVHEFRRLGRRHCAHKWLRKGAIHCEVIFRNPCGRCKSAFVFCIIPAKCTNIIQRPRFAAHDPFAAREVWDL